MSVTTGSAHPPALAHWAGAAQLGGADRFLAVDDPATGEPVARVPLADRTEVDAVVGLAAEAARDWGRTAIARRTEILFAFRALLHQHRDELAAIVTRENGKTLADARGEIARGLDVVDFACGAGELLKGEASSRVSGPVDAHSLRLPVGVVAGITPFNFPVMVPLWMAPVAIACGNAFVLKPSEQCPSPSLLVAELFARAGLPPGVFSVVHGDRATVEALLEHPRVDAVSFVGSTPVARAVQERAIAHGKRVQALGGAKNHAVVMPDADLGFAADSIAAAAYGAAGQRCMAVSVAVAVGPIADALVEELGMRARSIVVGAGDDPESQMGPLVSAAHRDRVVAAIAAGVEAGANLVVDGRAAPHGGRDEGFYVGPCLFDAVEAEMPVYRDEIFGPVLVVVRVPDYATALALVNASPWGNGAAIFTADGRTARDFELEVQAGMVGVNVPIPVPVAYHSFGGWKASLFGDLHIHGPDGVRFYTRGKVVSTRWPVPADGGLDLGFPTHG